MDRELFGLWFKHHFLNYVPSVRPILLLMDGHSSHYCPNTIKLAAQEQVILFALPPNTTHLSQPLDKGCFGPLKLAWREECHQYLAKNPGRVITKFQFSSLFRNAWLKSMTVGNIVQGFKVTGVYPVDRSVLLPQSQECETLTKKTGLSFIPLYSPHRSLHSPGLRCGGPGHALVESPAINSDLDVSFTDEEVTLFQTRYENGYDIAGDDRYTQWLSMYHPGAVQSIQPLSYASSSVRKYASLPPPPSRIPSIRPKSCGRVLTSAEYMKIMEEKERVKKSKEDAKRERGGVSRKKKTSVKSISGIVQLFKLGLFHCYVLNKQNMFRFWTRNVYFT